MIESVGFVLGVVVTATLAIAIVAGWVVRIVGAVLEVVVPERPPEPELSPRAQRQVRAWPEPPPEPRTRVTYSSW